jgi:hypothetical protein
LGSATRPKLSALFRAIHGIQHDIRSGRVRLPQNELVAAAKAFPARNGQFETESAEVFQNFCGGCLDRGVGIRIA